MQQYAFNGISLPLQKDTDIIINMKGKPIPLPSPCHPAGHPCVSVEEVASLVSRALHQEDVGKDTDGGLPLLGSLLWCPLDEGRPRQGSGRERGVRGGERGDGRGEGRGKERERRGGKEGVQRGEGG